MTSNSSEEYRITFRWRRLFTIVGLVGALNWGLIGLFEWDFVAAICGGGGSEPTSLLSRIVYTSVGLAALFGLALMPTRFDASVKSHADL